MNRHVIALLIGAAAALVSSGVWAQSGIINITGSLQGTSCKINGSMRGSAPVPVGVTMDTLATNILSNTGNTAGLKSFRIELSDCDPATYKIKFDPDSATTVDVESGRLRNTATGATAATNVQIQVLNKDLGVIHLISGAGNTQQITVPTPATGASPIPAPFDFFVRYFATGAATGGTVTGTLPFSIQFN